ncbi:Fungal specific transcription factor domain-containing protein [Pleurostoma richardsiae]|uniref:Fungal specific transcription factor domain-containing protein n=1 Tax=Pleurostoma richardsiae TaxID=41990 RepID=A0AA38S2G5_9PEZI|nr:Fungal specific transcription factor domain-containing protein [Pleurostoma richardsiae]
MNPQTGTQERTSKVLDVTVRQPPRSITAVEEVSSAFDSLGAGDEPRPLAVSGMADISKQTSILVDFLSQDFSLSPINDYQVTFNDNYCNITRVLANEFGRGFTEGIYHHRDAPFVKRHHGGGIPRPLTGAERAVLELQGAFVLPSQRIADSFVTAFFDRVQPMMPIIDRSEFLKHYYAMGSASPGVSLLLLQSILLSGSATYRHPDLALDPREVSWRLYVRAKALMDNRFEQDRLILVQAHLLFSTFGSDSCDDTIQNMWLSIGSAVRIAQGLGLHRALGNANASQSMRRQWKRIWWTLFVHDTLCSFEWGRPRSIHLPDSDVDLLTVSDFQLEEAGSLPSSEHTHFFIQLCELCFIISDWLDVFRPGGPRRRTQSEEERRQERIRKTRKCISDLTNWHHDLPGIMQAPLANSGFTLWTATLHITYYAAQLRFSALLPDSTDAVYEAASKITDICGDLDRQGLLHSLWNFGIHEFDLAMGQHARQVNSKSPGVSGVGFQNLRRGLPLIQQLCNRSFVASQGAVFYQQLIGKFEKHLQRGSEHSDVHTQGAPSDPGQQPTTPDLHTGVTPPWMAEAMENWENGFEFHEHSFANWTAQQAGQPWGWDTGL